MQHSDERPPTSGRPSLLSTEQQADADRNRILGTLDGKSGPAPEAMPGKRKYSLLAGALVAVVAIGAGSAVWLSGEGEKEIVLASSAPLPAAPAPAAPLASEPPPIDPVAQDVSTAAILQDMPSADANPAAPADARPAAPPADAAPAATDALKPADDLASLLERPAGTAAAAPALAAVVAGKAAPAPAKPAPRPAAKPAPRKTVTAKAARPKAGSASAAKKPGQKSAAKTAVAAAPARKKTEARPTAQQQDTDVTLLAALVAHSKATTPKKAVTPAEKLRQCKTLASVSEADQCRARLCASSAKHEAQCKTARLAKAPEQS